MPQQYLFVTLAPVEWAAVVNAVAVVVLAFINYRYMKSAAKQAEAAKAQADAAEKSMGLLQSQMADRAGLDFIRTITTLRYMQSELFRWPTLLREKWGVLPEFQSLLPHEWPEILFVVERTAPDQVERLRATEQKLISATQKIKEQLGQQTGYRQERMFIEAANDIDAARNPLNIVLLDLERRKSSSAAAGAGTT